jgi:hypothetical protein
MVVSEYNKMQLGLSSPKSSLTSASSVAIASSDNTSQVQLRPNKARTYFTPLKADSFKHSEAKKTQNAIQDSKVLSQLPLKKWDATNITLKNKDKSFNSEFTKPLNENFSKLRKFLSKIQRELEIKRLFEDDPDENLVSITFPSGVIQVDANDPEVNIDQLKKDAKHAQYLEAMMYASPDPKTRLQNAKAINGGSISGLDQRIINDIKASVQSVDFKMTKGDPARAELKQLGLSTAELKS